MLASDLCSRLLDGHNVKWMGKIVQISLLKRKCTGNYAKIGKKDWELSNPSLDSAAIVINFQLWKVETFTYAIQTSW